MNRHQVPVDSIETTGQLAKDILKELLLVLNDRQKKKGKLKW